jgi:hypothetical protein
VSPTRTAQEVRAAVLQLLQQCVVGVEALVMAYGTKVGRSSAASPARALTGTQGPAQQGAAAPSIRQMGGDSLAMTRLSSQLHATFDVTVPPLPRVRRAKPWAPLSRSLRPQVSTSELLGDNMTVEELVATVRRFMADPSAGR